MALTIEQIQANITNKMDARLIINQMADYIQANPGGGGSGMVLEEYENSAMSAPVMAYVFRDEDDNIFRVYEPIKNNDVSRKNYDYADSIDQFPFDNEDWFGNTFKDVKLLNLDSENTILNGNYLSAIAINFNNVPTEFLQNWWVGNYSSGCPSNAELYLNGDVIEFGDLITFCGNHVWGADGDQGNSAYFDNVGVNSKISGSQFSQSCKFDINGNKITIIDSTFKSYVVFNVQETNANIGDSFFADGADLLVVSGAVNPNVDRFQCGVYSSIILKKNIQRTSIGVDTDLDTTLGSVTRLQIDDNASYAPSSDVADKKIVCIGGVAYEIGEDTGAATLTAV